MGDLCDGIFGLGFSPIQNEHTSPGAKILADRLYEVLPSKDPGFILDELSLRQCIDTLWGLCATGISDHQLAKILIQGFNQLPFESLENELVSSECEKLAEIYQYLKIGKNSPINPSDNFKYNDKFLLNMGLN
jgi:hypothetical protein